MPTATQVKFDGGHAEDIRTFATDECEKSLNFDIFTNPHKLLPYPDGIVETPASGAMADLQISDVDVSLIGTSYLMTGVGYESGASAKPTFYTKSDIVTAFTSQAVAAGNTYQKNSLVIYKNKAFGLAYNVSNQYILYRYDSAGSITTIGTISTSSQFYAKPFVHPEDKILYIIIGSTITSWNDSSLVTTTTILPTDMEATSQTDYGTYLAISMRPLRGNGNSIVYLWGRDASINTLQGQVNFGDGNLLILENLNNILIAVMQPQNALTTAMVNKIRVRGYAGGTVETLKSIVITGTQTGNPLKVKNGEKLYFGFNNDDCIYVFGKNKEGNWIITKDRYYYNGTTIGSAFAGLSMIGDIMWRLFSTVAGAYILMRQKVISYLGETATYTSVSTYKTTINPGMAVADRGKNKQLKAFRIYFTGKASGTIGVKYSVDGSAMTSIISESTTAIEDMKQTTMQVDGNAFIAGRELQFQLESTGGVEIKNYEYEYDNLNQ